MHETYTNCSASFALVEYGVNIWLINKNKLQIWQIEKIIELKSSREDVWGILRFPWENGRVLVLRGI